MRVKKFFSIIILMLLLLNVTIPIAKADSVEEKQEISVSYYTHIQDIGWEREFVHKDGEMSGTVGQAKPIEAIVIKSDDLPKGITLRYRTHVRDIGWQDWKKNGEMAGTTGRAKSIEAIQIQLQNTSEYMVQYRAHVRGIGWQEWVSNGEIAGTTGMAKPIEAIQIRIMKKYGSVTYQAHVSDIGWMNEVSDGEVAGTTGQAKPIEALYINAKNLENIPIQYQAHVQDIGWMNWVSNGEMAGTTGKAKPMEAIRIQFKQANDNYSIMYRAHVRDIGWMDWVYDEEIAGTTGRAKSIEAIQIKIVPKPDKQKANLYLDTPVDKTNNGTTELVSGWVMTSLKGTRIDVKIDNVTVSNISSLIRVDRPDVIQKVTGYGGIENNPKPGFQITVDFSTYAPGNHILAVQLISKEAEVLKEKTAKIYVDTRGTYGSSGLAHKGDGRGSQLEYYKFGTGPNVLFATFTVHGFEDQWNHDGEELVTIANNFYDRLKDGTYGDVAQKWTIYIFPEVNPDGRRYGYTKDGPGRTTLFSQAPANRGIDLNRCWQINGVAYTRYTSSRNYNGTAGFQAYEAQALRDFLLSNQSKTGQTILIDLHGWLNQLIGDRDICMNYYYPRFGGSNLSSLGSYGTGYLVNWARSTLRSSTRNARSALIELPSAGINSHQAVINQNLSNRYIDSTIDMLRRISVPANIRTMAINTQQPSDVLEISQEEQYNTTLAGIIKQDKPQKDEVEKLVSQKLNDNGIWISENSRETFTTLINSYTNQEYQVNDEGYLEIAHVSENKNNYDIAIETAINSEKQYTIDMSGKYYLVDHMTGLIESNLFEGMDPYQVYEYVEAENKKIILLTSNKQNELTDDEIIEGLVDTLN